MARLKISSCDEVFDTTQKYSDEFYVNYLRQFQQNVKSKRFFRFVKRSFDIIVSFFALTILAPLIFGIAVAIKCDSKGPIFFKQTRIGKDGKEFYCYKFRSMSIEAPHDLATSNLENPERYITKVGAFIRKTSLDELPQLFCCLIGTMSLIGYRPLIPGEKKCNDMRQSLGVFEMRPGISGFAQVYGRDDVYYKNKAILDAEYVKNASILFDLKLLFQTVIIVLRRDGNADN